MAQHRASSAIWMSIAVAAVVVVMLSSFADAKHVKGHMSTSGDWNFLTKFCYDKVHDADDSYPGPGQLHGTIYARTKFPTFKIVIYDDENEEWPTVYHSDHSCLAKTKLSQVGGPAKQTKYFGKDGENAIDFSIRNEARPRFWYIVAANCTHNLQFSYDITMKNPGSSWDEHFSYDEQGLATMSIVFAIVISIITGFHVANVQALRRTQSLHPIVVLLTVALIMESVSLIFSTIHYGVYSGDGEGVQALRTLAEVLDVISNLVFMLLLILLAKGWTVSTLELTNKKVIIVLGGMFLMAYAGLFMYEYLSRDPASTLYIYESVPGIIILILRCLTLCWFGYLAFNSFYYENHDAKRKFYFVFGTLYGIWWLSLPLLVCAASALAPWVRRKTVEALYLCIQTIAMGSLVWLLAPNRATEFFKISPPDLHSTTIYDAL
eukprot:GFYU01003708.1.p1 GENE.GFYU01003708.1~~GFYU01003708.1.p1  ORF type:complete len:435 (+),score=100.52 GFYU01003708.1:245-1549(+)